MTNIELAVYTLFNTKNKDKITSNINRLALHEKLAFFDDDQIQQRISKVFDENMYVRYLIDFPIEKRLAFAKTFSTSFSLELLDFLLLEDFNDYDIALFAKISDNNTILLMLRKINLDNLVKILNYDNLSKIHNLVLSEISKKSKQLTLTSEDLQKIDIMTLALVLKQRNIKEKESSITCDEFVKLDTDRQKVISNYIPIPFEEVAQYYNSEVSTLTDEQKLEKFNLILNSLNNSQIQMLKLKLLVTNSSDSLAKEMAKKFLQFSMKSECELPSNFTDSILFQLKQINADSKQLLELSRLGKPFAVVRYLKTGIIDNTTDRQFNDIITLEQFIKTSSKHTGKILNTLNVLYNNYVGNVQNEQFINAFDRHTARRNNFTINEKGNILLAHKMYYIFGYENTIELLNGKHGSFSLYDLYKLFYACDVQQVQFTESNKQLVPMVDTNLINFFIGDKKDQNTTIKKVLRKELDEVYKSFPFIYNNFKKIQALIGEKIHLNKLLPLIKEAMFPLLPSEYKLNKELIDKIIKSYGYEDVLELQTEDKQATQEAVNQATNFYHNNLEQRQYSSIPRVYGTTNSDYSYEVLKLDDPTAMVVGYETGCCFRLNGLSKDFLKYCCSSENGRIVVVRNEFGELVAMTPVVRNGNVIVGNSIESKKTKSEEAKVYNAYKQAMNEIISISIANEEMPIIGAVVTDLHGNVSHHSKGKLDKNISPIYETGSFYNNYESPQHLVSIVEGQTPDNFQSYIPQSIYMDERPNLLSSNRFDEKDEDFESRLKSILFQKGKFDEHLYQHFNWQYRGIICSEDWYMGIGYNGLEGECLDKDWRAQIEFDATKEYLESIILGKDSYFPPEIAIDDISSRCLCKTLTKQADPQQSSLKN